MARFTQTQILRLANIFDNAGQVLLATVVLPPIFTQESGRIETNIIFIGMLSTIAAWWISLRLERIGGS